MELLEAIIMGIIQGIFEWLPVSSEGINSIVLLNFFNKSFTEAIYLSIWLHLGTMLSAMVFFRKTIYRLIKNLPKYRFNNNPENKLTSFIFLTTLISGILGGTFLLLGVEKLNLPYYYAMLLIGGALIITGFLQLFANNENKIKSGLKVKDSFSLGILQGFSVLPGISRSGITVSTLLLKNYSVEKSLKLSFILSIPLVFGAELGILLLEKVQFNIYSLVSIFVAFIVGLISINLFINFAKKINFGIICLIIGVLSIVAAFI